jgi:hypothetical protein
MEVMEAMEEIESADDAEELFHVRDANGGEPFFNAPWCRGSLRRLLPQKKSQKHMP